MIMMCRIACCGFFCLLFLACNTTVPQKPQSAIGMSALQASDEPCWIRTPDCAASENDPHIYFAGQSDRLYPSAGRPTRAAFESASQDAMLQYAKYLSVELSNELTGKQHLANGQSQEQFEQIIKESVKQQISNLIKSDEYYVSNSSNKAGTPLWSVYVLLKISRTDVAQHRNQMMGELTTPKTLASAQTNRPYTNNKPLGKPTSLSIEDVLISNNLSGSLSDKYINSDLFDGNQHTYWKIRKQALKPGLTVHFQMVEPLIISSIELFRPHGVNASSHPKDIEIRIRKPSGQWLPPKKFRAPQDSGFLNLNYNFPEPIAGLEITFLSNWGHHTAVIGDIEIRGYINDQVLQTH